ncbi:hypothetical protein [Prosthecobacter sp.]|uniref:hypothetical protein n=1 Tax=Prosthecobacter sp. TaxID=1965333 RepID=UPI003783CCE9
MKSSASIRLLLLFASILMAQTMAGLAQDKSPAATNRLSEDAAKLARDIADRRGRGEVIRPLMDMHKLMRLWSPVGLPKEQVIQCLGQPSSGTDKVIIYRFDFGDGGWQWEFDLEKGVVSKVHKVSLE